MAERHADAFEHASVGRSAHHPEQIIGGGGDDEDGRIKGAVAVEARQPGKDSDAEGEENSDEAGQVT